MAIKALIVDDEPVNRELLKGILAPFGEIHTVASGKEGIDAFVKALDEKAPYNLICLDVMMPQMTGHKALEQIRAIERERGLGWSENVKIIMVSALSDEKSIKQAFIQGQCEAYLVKPIDRYKFVEQIRNLGIPLRSFEM